MEDPISFTTSELLPIEDLDLDRCKLLGPVALAVQGAMGLIVIGGLVIKRMREKPRRKWKIWLADVGKQVVGQFAVHLSNVAISDLIATNRADNPCSIYALNILIDTTLGVLLIYFLLQYSTQLMQRYQPHYKTGFYGTPFSFSLWAEQAAVYVACLAVMKIVVVLVFWIAPELEDGMSWGLSWIENEEAQVVVVMLMLPLVMNLFQFLMVDSIIRSKDPNSPSVIAQNSDEESVRRGLIETESDDEDEGTNADRPRSTRRGLRRSSDGDEGYPDLAGGDEDEEGKQKQATELLFDADSPMLQPASGLRNYGETRHAYPPTSHAITSTLPPYSALPPSTHAGPHESRDGQKFGQGQLERGEEEGEEEGEDDGWGEVWDVDDQPKPIPLEPTAFAHGRTSPPSSSPAAEVSPPVIPSIPPPSQPSPPRNPFSTFESDQPGLPPSSTRENDNEEDENDQDWGFDDSMSSPPRISISPDEEVPELRRGLSHVPERREDAIHEPVRVESPRSPPATVGDGADEENDDWGFDDSLSDPSSPIPPSVPDTSSAVEKALGLDETRLDGMEPTIKAPSEVGKELGILS